MVAEVLTKHSIEGLEIAGVIEPHAATHHVLWSIPRFFKNCQKISDGLVGLSDYVAVNYFPVHHRNLTRYIEPAIGFNGPGKWQMLTSSALTPFNAISLDAHLDLYLNL
jgi:hypothetical protein